MGRPKKPSIAETTVTVIDDKHHKHHNKVEAPAYTIEPLKLPWLIKKIALYSFIWEVFLYLLNALHHLNLTYGSFFTSFDKQLWDTIYVVDVFYTVDVIMRIGVEIWRYLSQSEVLVFILPYKFWWAIADTFSLIPAHFVFAYITQTDSLGTLSFLDYFRFNNFVRLYRGISFFDYLESLRIFSEEVLFIMRFATLYLGFINIVSCIFFILVFVKPIDFLLWRHLAKVDLSWAKNFKDKKIGYGQGPWDLYILSTHFSTATVTTVGYGDFHAETELEMAFCIVIMLIGAIFLNGYFTSQITNFQLESDGARFDLFFRVDGIKKHLEQAGMIPFFTAKVEHYYKCLWTYREGVDRVQFIDHLPRSFQEDMYYDVCLEMFHKSFLFYNMDEAFLRAVSKIVKIALYNPDMILCRYGGYANQMYYILQGECQAMSKHESSKRAAILRAGSIIGEINLFFSCPYTASVETKTCCQFISIDKEELMAVFNKFPQELMVLRTRSQVKVDQIYKHFDVYGKDPVCWVQRRVPKSELDALPEINCTLRWGDGFNPKVTEDVILDVERFVIFETPCLNKAVKKDHTVCYQTSVVPEILNSELTWVAYWNMVIIISSMMYAFIAPYCLAFQESSQIEHHLCHASIVYHYLNSIFYIADVFVEVIGACPVEGLYYRFWDGLHMKSGDAFFYLDILAALPLDWLGDKKAVGDYWEEVNVVLKSMKIWKVIRYLRYLDNVYPKSNFWFRLSQTFIVLMYGIHFISSVLFILACPTIFKKENGKDVATLNCVPSKSWLASYKNAAEANGDLPNPLYEPDELSKGSPYLLSFYFSAATLTSAGFGDFNPQTSGEMILTVFFQLVGFFIIGYYTALLTSALACVVKPRLEFQQKLVAVKKFMGYYRIPELLQRRVIEHYELQHQMNHGVNLPPGESHYLFDSPDYLRHDVLYTDAVLLLDGIPLFTKTDTKNIIKLSGSMKRYLIPPNVKFIHKGEVRKAMYGVKYGSIGVFDGQSNTPFFSLESTAYIGLRDLLFGDPAKFDYITLSYCLLFEIPNSLFLEVFEDDDELMEHINSHKKPEKGKGDQEDEDVARRAVTHEKMKQDRSVDIPSWIWFKDSKTDPNEALRFAEYKALFKEFRFGGLFKLFLLRGVVHPVGRFAKMWTTWMSVVTCFYLCFLVMETFMYVRNPPLRIFIRILDFFFFMDVYVRLHWGYYLGNGLLVSHPLKTAGLYLFEGTFFLDAIFCAPLEGMLFFLGSVDAYGYGVGTTWFTKLRWIRFIQIKRIPQTFGIIHTIFKWRNSILFGLYVSVTVLVCTIVATIALYIGCPWTANEWKDGDEYKLPYCLGDTWATKKFGGTGAGAVETMSGVSNRWVVGVYYVCQVILVIGFGDMITILSSAEVNLLIFMSVFGFIFMRCVIADITAAEVDSDEIRSRYIDQMKRLVTVMSREKVNKKLLSCVLEHLNFTWKMSKGLKPRELFGDLHPALESDVFRNYVGDQLRLVPVFKNFAPNVLRGLCQYVKKLYFVKGERIARYGNLESEMHIIISGKVWVTDRFLNYGCTLHKNESFGETAVLSNTNNTRRYNVIAATTVEVFVLTQEDFTYILKRYPVIRRMLTIRTGNGHYDFFEHRIHSIIDALKALSAEEKEVEVVKLQSYTDEIKQVIYGREPPPEDDDDFLKFSGVADRVKKLTKNIISWGFDDDNLPFIYFAAQRSKSTGKSVCFPPLIHPNCGLLKAFLSFIYILCFFYPAVAVYQISFSEINDTEDVINNVIFYLDLVLLTYIVLNFIMPFEDADGGYFVKNSWSVFATYLLSPTGFMIDALALVPGMLPLNIPHLRYFRLLWLYRYVNHHLSKRDDLSISTFQFKITLSVSAFCFMAHILACIFYAISACGKNLEDENNCLKNGQTNSWTHQFALDADLGNNKAAYQPWRWWVRALYWVVTVISTTGFGDITPQNVREMIMGIVCVFCGAFILSIILSHFTSGMASLTKSHREYLYQVKLLVKYLRNIGLSSLRQSQVNEYFEMVWASCRGILYHKCVEILPTSLKIEVANALFEPVLKQVRFFNIQDKCFIRQLATRVTHSMYLPGVCIVKQGDQGNVLYIVYKGRVSGINEKEVLNRQLRNVYLVGDVFGKLPALFYDEWYKKSYRADVKTEVLSLRQKDIIQLASIYPEFWKMLLAYVEVTYDPLQQSDCIFAELRTRAKNIYDLGDDYQKMEQSINPGKSVDKKKKQKLQVYATKQSHQNSPFDNKGTYLARPSTSKKADIPKSKRKSTLPNVGRHPSLTPDKDNLGGNNRKNLWKSVSAKGKALQFFESTSETSKDKGKNPNKKKHTDTTEEGTNKTERSGKHSKANHERGSTTLDLDHTHRRSMKK